MRLKRNITNINGMNKLFSSIQTKLQFSRQKTILISLSSKWFLHAGIKNGFAGSKLIPKPHGFSG